MEEIVTIDEMQYRLTYDQPLTVEQRAQAIEDIRKQPLSLVDGWNWDRMRIKPPICYLPPIWEWIINRNLDKVVKETMIKPSPDPWSIANHMRARIDLVNQLVKAGKLDSRIGNIAMDHFETHLNELKEIQAKG